MSMEDCQQIPVVLEQCKRHHRDGVGNTGSPGILSDMEKKLFMEMHSLTLPDRTLPDRTEKAVRIQKRKHTQMQLQTQPPPRCPGAPPACEQHDPPPGEPPNKTTLTATSTGNCPSLLASQLGLRLPIRGVRLVGFTSLSFNQTHLAVSREA